MKRFMPFFLLLAATDMHGQNTGRNYVSPDPAKVKAVVLPKPGKPVPCAGSANTRSADLNWRPMLTKKPIEIEHGAPRQHYIDSVKAAKMKLKQAYKQTHHPSAQRTTSSAIYPAVGTNFEGNGYDGVYPLDNCLAISHNGTIVSVTNIEIDYYDSTGANLYTNSISSFFSSVLDTNSRFVSDPVVLYDPAADRFIFLCLGVSPISIYDSSQVLIAFSKSNNPMAGWWCYTIDGDPTGGDTGLLDYPKIAVNDSEVFFTGNEFYSSGIIGTIFQMDKLAGYAGAPLNYVYYMNIPDSPFTVLPVGYGQDSDAGAGMVFVSSYPYGDTAIALLKINNNLCCSPTLSYWSVSTTPYGLPADALSSTMTDGYLTIDDCRMMTGMYLDGIVHFTFNSDAGSGFSGLNYNRLDMSTLTNVSSIYGVPGYDYAYGGLASFATSPTDRSVMIGCDVASLYSNPEVRVVACDSSMNWSADVSVQPGTGMPPSPRWGDYTGMWRNHVSPTPSVWMSGCYGTTGAWGTWIAEIHSGVPVLGVNQPKETATAKVFPNPVTKNIFTLEFSLAENAIVNISLSDVNGRLVKELFDGRASAGDNVFSFNKANLASGVYFLNINAANEAVKTEKIVIAE